MSASKFRLALIQLAVTTNKTKNLVRANKITVRESDYFAAGDRLTTFDRPFCKVGVGICYDLRFAPQAEIYAKLFCKLLVYPGSFTRTGHGKMTVRESDYYAAGDKLITFDTPFCKVGVGICYDLRFAPQAEIYTKLGCKLLVYPGSFNLATGPLHWKLLQRARAVDNQVYVASTSLARDEAACYVTWGYSMFVDPSGRRELSLPCSELV
ncbi:hypothetical protein HPB47_014735 [Ixodes persulcatus]|uniref:Uncharacterized protein n=1 Tax=Ixodes persulcatus TaxID=34615 RepID=A0AC60QW50_IXOPE|nr:hypothetical protein HPB47_014735 [Ixodes persulcatus]